MQRTSRLWFISIVLVGIAVNLASTGNADDKGPKQDHPNGIALTIGLNSIDPAHYAGWTGKLAGCENDANDMAKIAAAKGFKVTTLLTREAKREKVIGEISAAARVLKSGDVFLLTYAGHGGQMQDLNQDEDDLVDETWCLYDGQVIDDELAAVWPKFAPGVRIFVVSDSCHSGSVTRSAEFKRIAGVAPRAMPEDEAAGTFRQNRKFYQEIGSAASTEKTSAQQTKCTVLLISACQDDQLAGDGAQNGLFTAKLKEVWNGGQFAGGYPEFHQAIVKKMPKYQRPNYYVIGAPNKEFEKQTPFARQSPSNTAHGGR